MTLQRATQIAADPVGYDITVLAAAHNALQEDLDSGLSEHAYLIQQLTDDLWTYMAGLIR